MHRSLKHSNWAYAAFYGAFWSLLLLAALCVTVSGCVVEPARVRVPEVCAGHVGGTRNGGLVIEPPHECGPPPAPRYESEHRRGW